MRRCEIASERERRGREGGECARARGVGNNTRGGIHQVPSNAWAWMLVPGGYLTSTSLGLYLGLALGTRLVLFSFFFFFPFFGELLAAFLVML